MGAVTGAAKYTEVSLEDMEKFLKRGFRAMRPKAGDERGEIYYDLNLSSEVQVRVWTSIARGGSSGAGVGQDAIRLQLRGRKVNRPLMKGKAPIVKRTQNWRNSLQKRIEEFIETYEEKQEYWESRATGSAETPKPAERPSQPAGYVEPTDKQIRYVKVLLRGLTDQDWSTIKFSDKFPRVPTEEDLRSMSRKQVSYLIDLLKNSGYGRSYYAAESE